jgi:CheY-like chemotaxis protein
MRPDGGRRDHWVPFSFSIWAKFPTARFAKGPVRPRLLGLPQDWLLSENWHPHAALWLMAAGAACSLILNGRPTILIRCSRAISVDPTEWVAELDWTDGVLQRPEPLFKRLRRLTSMVNRRHRTVPSPPPRRILVVEDDLLVALIIEEMVRDCGRRVSSIAPNAATARQRFATGDFDAVLLDLNLQDQPHPELADILLAKDVPFAFVTGFDYLIEPRHEGVPVLQKPFTSGQLGALLAALVPQGDVAKAI